MRGQGTIEYLVILAIVVVIALTVVALFAGIASSPSTQISSSAGKLGSTSGGGIIVTEAIIDSQGNAIVSFQNASGETVTVNKISQGKDNVDITEVFFNEQIVSGAKSFYLTDFNKLCECSAELNSRNCEFIITYTTLNNLTKTEKFTVNTQCVSNVTPKEPENIIGLGNGTLANPWIINNCTELQNMNQRLDGNYALGGDINCYETINWNSEAGFGPVGNTNNPFTGSLDGKEKTIYNLKIYQTTIRVGLIGYGENATLTNLNLVDFNVYGTYNVGSLGGELVSSEINNITASGFVQGTSHSNGGIVGQIAYNSSIANSYSSVDINSGESSGGIVGEAWFGSVIRNSYSSDSNIKGAYQVGGIVGQLFEDSNVYNCYSTSLIQGAVIGGIVGHMGNGGLLEKSYFAGSVYGTQAGGLIGVAENGDDEKEINIINSFSTGFIETGEYNNGLIGDYVGDATITNSNWDTNLSGQSNCNQDGNSGCTPTNNQASLYYGALGIPFASSPGLEWSTDIWQANENAYPTLR